MILHLNFNITQQVLIVYIIPSQPKHYNSTETEAETGVTGLLWSSTVNWCDWQYAEYFLNNF